jgi:beta-glucosidase
MIRCITLSALSLLLNCALPLHGASWTVPTTESIQRALSENKLVTYSLAGTAACVATTVTLFKTDIGATQIGDESIYWDWSKIDVTDVDFSGDFIFGAGTSSFQVEGYCHNTDWWRWEQGNYEDGSSHVQDRSGKACDQWTKYKEDIKLLAQMSVGIYRFSIAWDKIQPTAESFDTAALEHYKDMCRELNRYGIKAHIGFHHYTDPIWFADLGGFANEGNIHYFAGYCAYILEEFAKDPEVNETVKLWSTFNSPSGYAFHKYHTGCFPPGIKNDKQLTLTVLKNMMEAHVQAYQAKARVNPAAQLGLLKNIMQLEPWRPWHPMDNFACSIASKMTDESIFSFFTTGRFVAKIPFDSAPFMANVVHENSLAPYSLDFIGLNYYGHSYLKNMTRFLHPDEITTQNPNYSMYPEGLYRAIKTITEKIVQPIEQLSNGKHIPIYVTENGTTDNSPGNRELFFKRYLYAMHRARSEGDDVRGYICWSFMDNYEWGSYDKKYGLVHVDFESPELTRTIKQDPGTQYYLNLMKACRPALQSNHAASSVPE